ncbi:MAG TPA: hypothetical protein VMI10_07340 [Terriglobales bacterium]|nr:hypothetical protein [Terriglobales bacterium]
MNDAVISQRVFTAFLVTVVSFVLAAFKSRGWARTLVPTHTSARPASAFLCAFPAEKNPDGPLDARAPHVSNGTEKHPAKSRWPAAGDWIAPLVVWFLVIGLGMAIVSLLLGER